MAEENNQSNENTAQEDPVETARERGLRKLRELQQPLFDTANFKQPMHPLHGAFGKEL